MQRKEICFVAVIAVLIIVLFFLPTGHENPSLQESILYEKARVLEVNNEDIETISVAMMGTQELKVEFLSGEMEGEIVDAQNILVGQKSRDKFFEPGDKVLTVTRLGDMREITSTRVEDYYRGDLQLILFLAFLVCLVLFAGRTGAKAALSFVFTALVFWKLLLPSLLAGYSPLMVSIGVVFVTTTVIILLVGGLNPRGYVALSGAMLGVVATAVLATVFGYFFKIPGTIMEFSESLLYTGYTNLDYSDMFLASIYISSAGAVMDVAMDISAAQDELVKKIPTIGVRELIKSGLNIASPVVGSMTTTLFFAYSGSFMFAFMAFMAQGVPMISIVNKGFISAEILHTMVGSFGLVLVAPITALIGGYFFSRFAKSKAI